MVCKLIYLPNDGNISKCYSILLQEPPKNIAIKVDFKGNNIGGSEIITSERSEVEVNWEVFYEVPNITENVVDDLIAHPFVCKLKVMLRILLLSSCELFF